MPITANYLHNLLLKYLSKERNNTGRIEIAVN